MGGAVRHKEQDLREPSTPEGGMTTPEIRSNRGGGTTWVMTFWTGITQVLTLWTGRHPLSWLLLCVEGIVLMGGTLGPLLIGNLTNGDAGTSSVQVNRWTYEFLVLGLLVVFWCGWCEGGYRLGRQMGNFAKVPWHRRVTLELWTGVLFSLLLSVLTSLSTLLPLVAMFLVFGGIESLKASGSGQSLWASVLRGFRESFRTVSLRPLRLLILMAVPGLLLYLNSLVLRICQILLLSTTSDSMSGEVVVEVVALGVFILLLGLLGVGFFWVARMDLAMNYLQIQHIQVLGHFQQLDKILIRVRKCSRGVVACALLVLLLVGLYELIISELFSRNFFYMTLEASVGLVNGFVQSFIDLLAKFAFIFVVLSLIVGLCFLLVNLAKGNVNGILGRSLSFLGGRIQRFSKFISKQINIPGQAIQVTTLLSAVGLIATQTYTRIMEAQSLRLDQQRRQEQQVSLQLQRKQSYGEDAESQISRFQQNLQALVNKDRSESGWLDLDRRGQVASLTRDLTRKLKDPEGNPDGLRRARVLRYLYDSGFLIQNESGVAGSKPTCQDALSEVVKEGTPPRTLDTLPQLVLDSKLTHQIRTNPKPICQLARLVPLKMDFSYASLQDAFLNNATIPFINLSHADLQNAQLRNADLRFANLKNANLKGADLRGARLDFAYLANAQLSSATLDDHTSFDGAISFYSTRDKDLKGSLSWELTNNPRDKQPILWCPLDFRMDPEDSEKTENQSVASSLIAQAGAKCNNRPYSGYKRRSNLISGRNWASGDFSGTIIENFRLNHINFTNANLRGAVFKYVQLNNVDFTGAKLDGARFEDCVLNNVDFTGASIPRMVFKGSSVERLTFRGAQYVLPIELGDFADDLLLLSGRNMDLSQASNQSPPARLVQRLLLPLLLAPFPLRPSRVLIWLVPYSPELLFASEDRQSIP